MMNHPTSDQISELIDGTLDTAERARIEMHCAECVACAEMIALYSGIEGAARGQQLVVPSEDFMERVMAALPEKRREGVWIRVAAVGGVAAFYLSLFISTIFSGESGEAASGDGLLGRMMNDMVRMLVGSLSGETGGVVMSAVVAMVILLFVDKLMERTPGR